MNDIILYFNEELHKYTDVYGNTYTSVTTLIGNYKDKFDKWNVAKACERIGKNPTHPDYGKYRGKSAKRIIKEWDIINKEACEFGTEKHNYLEDSIKSANGYNRISNKYVNDRIYTVPEIIKNPNHGVLNLDYFKLKGIEKHYPIIYNFLSLLTNKGFRIYAEVGVFDVINLVSGLIDVFCYNPDKGTFLILDWKTNNAPIKFEAGYFKKDIAGNRLDTFINKEEYFKYPISHLQASKGNEYSLQLSLYSYLASKFKINHKGNVLFHIRHDVDENGLNIIDIPKLPDLTNESKLLLEHNLIKVKKNTVNKQGTLFNNLKKDNSLNLNIMKDITAPIFDDSDFDYYAPPLKPEAFYYITGTMEEIISRINEYCMARVKVDIVKIKEDLEDSWAVIKVNYSWK